MLDFKLPQPLRLVESLRGGLPYTLNPKGKTGARHLSFRLGEMELCFLERNMEPGFSISKTHKNRGCPCILQNWIYDSFLWALTKVRPYLDGQIMHDPLRKYIEPNFDNHWGTCGISSQLMTTLFRGVPIIRTRVFLGLDRGPLMLGNYPYNSLLDMPPRPPQIPFGTSISLMTL